MASQGSTKKYIKCAKVLSKSGKNLEPLNVRTGSTSNIASLVSKSFWTIHKSSLGLLAISAQFTSASILDMFTMEIRPF